MTDPVSRSVRFGLYLWNNGSATFTRDQMQTNQQQLEALAAKFRTGPSSERGSATSPANERSFFYNEDDTRLYFSDGQQWIAISGSVLPSNLSSTVAGSGLSLSSNTGLAVNVDNSTIDITGDTLRIPPNGVTSTQLKSEPGSEAVVNAVIAANAVNQDKIADDSIRNEHIKDGEVIFGKLGPNSVGFSNMRDNSVDTDQIVSGAVTHGKIATGADGIKTANIDDEQVTGEKIADLAVTPEKIDGVAGIDLGGIVTASAANTFTTLARGGNTQYLVADETQPSGLRWASLGVTQSQVTFDAITGGSQPAWLTWLGTAAPNAPAIANGSLDGYTFTLGKLVWVYIRLEIGADTTKGNDNEPWQFGLPEDAVAGRPQVLPGYVANNNLSIVRPITGLIRPTIAVKRVGMLTTPDGDLVHRQHPFLWPTGSFLVLEGWYQKA